MPSRRSRRARAPRGWRHNLGSDVGSGDDATLRLPKSAIKASMRASGVKDHGTRVTGVAYIYMYIYIRRPVAKRTSKYNPSKYLNPKP